MRDGTSYDLVSMARTSRSGNDPDERHWKPEDWFDEDADAFETDAPLDAANGRDPRDWKASLRDLELTWSDATRDGEERAAPPPDEWLQSLSDELQTRVDTEGRGGPTTADSPDSGGWWRLADEDAAFDVEDVPAPQPPETDERIDVSEDAPPVTRRASKPVSAPVRARARAPRRSRRWVALVAAAAVLLLGGATALVALAGRSDTGKPSAAKSKSGSTTRTSALGGTTTIAPTTPTTSVRTPAAPQSFTVQSTCGRRACALGVRAGPAKTAQLVNNIRTGQVVQIDCSTHGELVKDADSGQQSDMWYRYAGTNTYSSALYLQGPTVPSC